MVRKDTKNKDVFFTSNEDSVVEADCCQAPSNRWQRSSIHPCRGSLGVHFCVVSLDAIFVGTSSNQKNLKNILSNLIYFNIWFLVFIKKKRDNALIPNSRQCQWSVRKRATFCPSEGLEMALSSPLIPESCKQWPFSVNLQQVALLLCSLQWQQSYLSSGCRMSPAYNNLRMAQCEYDIWFLFPVNHCALIRRQQQQLYISCMKLAMIG